MRELKLRQLEPIIYNKTHRFLLDSLSLSPKVLVNIPIPNKIDTSMSVMKYYGYYNTYLSDVNHHKIYENGLVMLFNPNNKALENWGYLQTIFESYKNYNYTEDIELGLITVGMDIAKKEWWCLKDLLIKGKYSKFPKPYTTFAFNKSDGISSYYNKQGMICLKTEHYKKILEERIGQEVEDWMEYEEIPNLGEEILNINQLKFIY